MATLTHAESRRLYSWWWSSHISPKNSKWLQENLTDMDSRVKSMIKLIEEDADSFARRAEMYYKKRPELMKLVEEFYRAYRALAERYDQAMGELRQAHRTVAEAFPNQIPFVVSEDSLSPSSEAEPHTPETPHPIRSLLDPDDLQKDALGLSSHLHAVKRNIAYSEDGELSTNRKGLKQLNEMFGEGRAHNGLSFQDIEQRSSNYKFQKQEAEPRSEKVKQLQDELSKLSIENQNLTSRILLATEHSDKFESEVQTLRKSLSMLESEKEATALQYQECLQKVSNLEAEISREREVTSQLSGYEERCCLLEFTKQSLQFKVEALLHKTELQEKEIIKKQEDLQKLDTCFKEEQLHLMHAKAALQSLENFQAQSEEEKRKLALEIQSGVEKLREMELVKKELEQEVQQIQEDDCKLRDQNLSSDLLIKKLQDEVSNLKKAKQELEEEVTLLLDKQSALQQLLHSLKGDMEDLGRRHQYVIQQIESVGFNAETFQSSVKELQDENSNLKNTFTMVKDEKLSLLKKLGDMEKVCEKNSLLETSLSDANIELEGVRGKLKGVEESFHSLQSEKSDLLTEKNMLIFRVDHIAQNFEKLSETNTLLENSLSDLTVELDGFRVKSNFLEKSCHSLQNENCTILSERDNLVSRVETIQNSLEDLERRFSELEDKNSCLNEEKELALHQTNQLELFLAQKKEEHSLFVQSSKTQLANLENQICILQEQAELRKKEIEEEQEQLLIAHTEALVLQSCIIEMKQINDCLLGENQNHIKSLLHSENLVLELRREICELKERVKFLVEKNVKQRIEMNRVLKSLDSETVDEHDDKIDDHIVLNQILGKAKNFQWSLLNAEDEIERLIFERSINVLVLEEMRHGALNLKSEGDRLEHELNKKSEELSLLQSERCKLLEMYQVLQKDMEAGLHREGTLRTERDSLSGQLSKTQKAHHTLANENYELLEENQSWKKEFCFLRDEKYILEEEYNALLREALALGCLSQVFESSSTEKASELKELCGKIDCLREVNSDLKKEIATIGEKVGKVEMENLLLMESVRKLEGCRSQSVVLKDELFKVKSLNEELNSKTEIRNHLLSQKEMDLSDTLMKLEAKNEENIQLHNDAEALKEEACEAKRMIGDLQKSLAISEDKALHDEKEIMELLAREEWLKSELKRTINEVETSEMEAVELYKGLQVVGVLASVFEQKAYDLVGKYNSLEERSTLQMKKYAHDKALRDANDEELGRKMAALKVENEGLKREVTALLPLILSLKDSIFLLEGQTLSHTKIHEKDMQIPDSSYHQEATILALNKENNILESSVLLDILQAKVQAVTKAVVESKNLFMEENLKANVQLEAAKKEIEELKSKVYLVPDIMRSTRNLRSPMDEADISYTKMKDIQLDYVSDRGSPKLTSEAYAAPSHQIEDEEAIKIEKELVVDKVELSNKLSGRTKEGSRRMLERLISDAQRLTNVQASVQDLENKIEQADKGKLTSFEYNSLMAQLKEVEGTISQLFEMKGKLTNNPEEESMGSGRKIKRVDDVGLSRRQVSEQAQRWSEKIGRVELEVQQIRFLLLKLEEEFERRGKRDVERRRVQLRDYLYGRRQEDNRKKKHHLCVCARLLTKED